MSRKSRKKSNIIQKSFRQINENSVVQPALYTPRRPDFIQEMPMLSEWAYAMQHDMNIIKAKSPISSVTPDYKLIQQKQELDHKAVLLDPYHLQSGQGYIHKTSTGGVSFDILRHMSNTHIPRAIIETRKEQILSFCQPQTDKYSQGFLIRKKKEYYSDFELTLNAKDKKMIKFLTDFIMNCGTDGNIWTHDSFDVFTRKFIEDSLTLDQGCFEICRTPTGAPGKFLAVDGATIRLADTMDNHNYNSSVRLENGYTPKYVQVLDGMVKADFMPWELCFGVRNPRSDIRSMGYGHAELEDLITTVTNLLNADHYNGNYFRVGSNPSGIFRYSGSTTPSVINSMKNQWMAQTAGVNNFHKTPFIHADGLEYIKTHESNRDMEYAQYQEFLIKVCCALFKIDPSEIGFHLSGNANQKVTFEGNNAARLEYSKDKGLLPLLKQYAAWINQYLIRPITNDYEFVFVGLSENEEMTDLDSDLKLLAGFMTLNEIRAKRGLPPVELGENVLNSTYINLMIQKQNQELAANMGDDQNAAGSDSDTDESPYNQYEPTDTNQQVQTNDQNPITKAFIKDLPRLFN